MLCNTCLIVSCPVFKKPVKCSSYKKYLLFVLFCSPSWFRVIVELFVYICAPLSAFVLAKFYPKREMAKLPALSEN